LADLEGNIITCNELRCGTIDPVDTYDYYQLIVPGPDPLIVYASVFGNDSTCEWPYGMGTDPWVGLYDATCTIITSNEDNYGDCISPCRNPMNYDSMVGALLAPGIYYVGITTNYFGYGPYVLEICCEPMLEGDYCGDAIPVAVPAALPYSTANNTCLYNNFYYSSLLGCASTYGGASDDVVYELIVAADTCVTINVDSTDFDSALYLVDTCDGLGTCYYVQDDPEPYVFDITLPAGIYHLIVDGYSNYSNTCGNFTLDIDECLATPTPYASPAPSPTPGPGEDCSNPIPINCGDIVTGDTTTYVNDYSSYYCSTWNEGGPDVVYIVEACPGDLTATISGMTADLDVAIMDVCPPSSSYTICAVGNTTATVTVPAEGFYYIFVDGYGTAADVYTLEVTCNSPPCATPSPLPSPTPTPMPIEPPYFEGFESGMPPSFWTTEVIAGPNDWAATTSYEVEGTSQARLSYNYSLPVEARLISRTFDLSTQSDWVLSFWFYHLGYVTADAMQVEVSVNGGAWTAVGTPIPVAATSYAYNAYYEVDLASYSGPGYGDVKIALHGTIPANGWYISVDAFAIQRPRALFDAPVINEFCYDDASTDDLQFVELYYAGGGLDISGWRICSWNGSTGALSGTNNGQYTIPALSTIPLDGYFVIGQTLVDNLDYEVATFDLENGQDSVELQDPYCRPYDGAGWGVFPETYRNHGQGTPMADMTGEDVNTYQLCPDGDDTGDDATDYEWHPRSPGEENCVPPTPTPEPSPTEIPYTPTPTEVPTPAPVPATGPMGAAILLVLLSGLLSFRIIKRR
ncbi:lamin tail domain-containing protein, partial [bacterium]|nr:lamin tail domain-containing protein [candidate division CSSED10-310 bacterium]